MVSATKSLGLKLSKTKLAAIRRGAKRLGLTPAQYALTLLENGLAREKRIRETSLEVLSAPLTKALQGMTEEELDAMVDEARHAGLQRRKSR